LFTFLYFSLIHLSFSLQVAYLVAISDPSSVAGKPGLVDANQFQRARHDIQKACDDLLNPSSNQQQVSFNLNLLQYQIFFPASVQVNDCKR
jgi:hypothetical protein